MTMTAEPDAVVSEDVVDEDRAAEPEAVVSAAEETPDEGEGRKEKPLSAWERLRQLLFRGENRGQRLQQLHQAIADSPDAAVNYLLRGELYLEMHERGWAKADFERAAALAQEQYESRRWGIEAQAVQDRALRHLERLAE